MNKKINGFCFICFILLLMINISVSAASRFRGDVYVDFAAKNVTYEKVAVLPFKAPVELAGSSVSDFFTTELLKNYKYQMIERGQIENIFKEQALNLSGVTDDSIAIKVGSILGVKGSIIGTISEYGYQQDKARKLPSVGLSIRMIDTTTGKIVWSVSDSQVGSYKLSLSQHAKMMVKNMVAALLKKCREVGDKRATALPKPEFVNIKGGVRSVVLSWKSYAASLISSYEILRSTVLEGPYRLVGKKVNSGAAILQYTDKKLLDSSMYYYKIQGMTKNGLMTVPSQNKEVITAGPPKTPLNISAKSGDLRKVRVSWQPLKDPNVKGYMVFRRADNGALKQIAFLNGVNSAFYTDLGSKKKKLLDNYTYEYAVCSVNIADVKSKFSKVAMATTCPLPQAVTSLVAESALVKAVKLIWGEAQEIGLQGYCIYRSLFPDKDYKIINFTKGKKNTIFVDRGSKKQPLKDGLTYYYKVASYYNQDAIGESGDIAFATTKPLPVKVTGFDGISGQVKQISLSWNSNPEPDIKAYQIYRKKPKKRKFKSYVKVAADKTDFADQNLKDGTGFVYAIAAIDKDNLISIPCDPVKLHTKPIPAQPLGIRASLEDNAILLSWKPNAETDIDFYQLYQKKGFKKVFLDQTKDFSIYVNDVQPRKTYAFLLKAVDVEGLSSKFSKTIKVKVPKKKI